MAYNSPANIDARELIEQLLEKARPEIITNDMTAGAIEAAMRRIIWNLQNLAKIEEIAKKEPLAGWFCDCGARMKRVNPVVLICEYCGVKMVA